MTTLDERIAGQQQKVAALTAGVTPRTSEEGARINRVAQQPTPPIDFGSPELNQQAVAHNARIEEEAKELRESQSFPDAASARRAAQLLRDNADVWDASRLEAGWARVKKFVSENPEAVAQFQAATVREQWEADTIDTTPHASSRLRKAQQEAAHNRWNFEGPDETIAGQRFAAELFPTPKTVEELSPVDPDSRQGVLAAEEQRGLDTTSGFGGLGEAIGAATEFNSARARAGFLYATALDSIETSGIDLPDGILPVQLNEELGQLEYLNPTEEGKLRRTLVEGEFFRMADIGGAADLPELFSMITATGAAMLPVAGRHPLITEFAGDLVGRNAGVMLEFLLSNQEISEEELKTAFAGTITDAGVATALSRITQRSIETVGNIGTIKADIAKPGQAVRTAQEAADVMDAVNVINKGTDAPAFTLERGSLSLRESQIARGREKTLSKKAADAIEADRIARLESLSRANQRIAEQAGASPGPTDPLNVQQLTSRLNSSGEIEVVVPRRVAPGVDSLQYRFTGEVDAPGVGPGGRMGEAGVQVFVDHNRGIATLENVFAGEQFGGRTMELMERMLDDIPADYTIRSSGSVTRQGQRIVERLNDSGWKIEQRAGTQVDEKTGELLNLDGGVYEVIARPGEIRAPEAVLKADFSRSALENDLTEVLDSVPALEQMNVEAQAHLQGVIGWSPQRHTSKYSVENSRTSGVSQTVRRIQNRIQQSLTGAESSQANRTLNAAVRQEADEEGNTFLTGLASEELDLGNLLNAREAIASVAVKTQDPDMLRLTTDIDNLLKNAPVFTEKGNRIAASTRGNIFDAIVDARNTAELLDGQVGKINANQMFAQANDGTFLNTSLKNMRLILGNNSRYIKHMKPVIDGSPGVQQRATDALNSIYKADVLDKGWTSTRHQSFMNRYGDAAQDILHPEDLAILSDLRPPTGGVGRMQRIQQRQQERWNTLRERAGKFDVNPDNIMGSLQAMPAGRAKTFMYYADRLDPRLASQVRADMAQQIRNDLDVGFFRTERGLEKLGTGFKLKDWFNADNGARRRTIRAVLGEQYERDLGNIVEAHAIDAQRTQARGFRPETQGDVIRITRSLLGPLSRPQRQITALSYVRQRALARKVLNVMSNPSQLRALSEAGRLPARSRAGISALTRLGIFETAGIVDPENNPNEVQAFYEWIEETTRAGLEDKENVEGVSEPTTHDGFPLVHNPDGTTSSEISITITDPRINNGAPTNIPSLWERKRLGQDAAITKAVQSGRTFNSFNSIDEAVKAAGARSDALGRRGQ